MSSRLAWSRDASGMGGVFHEISSAGGAFVGPDHLGRDVTSLTAVLRRENRLQACNEQFPSDVREALSLKPIFHCWTPAAQTG